MSSPQPYCVYVQSSPAEIIAADGPAALNLELLNAWPRIEQVIVILPDIEAADQAKKKIERWGYRAGLGDAYNVAQRLLSTCEGQQYAVRVLGIWNHIDLDYVDMQVAEMQNNHSDLVAAPRDFDVTMAADVASTSALAHIAALSGDDPDTKRGQFNPWGYIETHPEQFDVSYLEPAPIYSPERVETVLASQTLHPENEFIGRDYSGTRYHHIVDKIAAGLKIMDIACGSGAGSELLSKRADFVLGVDYLEHYVEQARTRYPESVRLRFQSEDAQRFLYRGGEYFDLVVSFHTLEHVPNDEEMLLNLYRNLRPGGQLIVEVPLLAKRPLGQPLNPHHLREYDALKFIEQVERAGFMIENSIGVCRGFYVELERARDAIQLWAVKVAS